MPKTLTPRATSKAQKLKHFYVLGSSSKARLALPEQVTHWKPADVSSSVRSALGGAVFISYGRGSTDALLKASVGLKRGTRFDQLLAIEPPREASVPALLGLFKAVVGYGASYRWLPMNELLRVVTSDEAADRFIGGAVDGETQTLALVRGNGQTIVVPFSSFEPTGTGTKPDFSALAFTDYGHTVALGDYEASTDAVLYETDPDYRKQLKKDRKQSEKTFGASLSRLRLQKRLGRGDFAPLSAKTIARIERNEIEKPHGRTLEVIAKRLGVSADQIETY